MLKFEIFKNKTIINGFLFSLFSFFNQGISFFLILLLANYIAPAEYGKLSLYNTIIMFLGYFISLSTQGYISVSFFQRKDQFKTDFTIINIITFTITLVCLLILWAFNSSLVSLLNFNSILLYISILITATNLIYNIFLDYLRIKEKIYHYGFISCSFSVLNFALSLLFVINYHYGWQGRVYAQFICCIFFVLLAISYFLRNRLYSYKSITYSKILYIIQWGLPLIPHLASNWLKQGCDRYIINNFYSMDEVGIFSFALNYINIIIMVGVAFNSSNSVSIYKILSSNSINREQELNKNTKNIFFLYLIASILVIIIGTILIPIILPEYKKAIYYIIILGIYGFLQCLYFLYCNYLFYFNMNKDIMYLTFSTSILHLCLSFVLTRYSLYLTSIIYTISQSIIVFLLYKKSKKLISQKVKQTNEIIN